jgi:ActR/RegA family two-component response regulator
MADNDQLLDQMRKVVREEVKAETEPIKKDLQDVKQGQAHLTTAVEAVKAGQDDLIEKVANLPTRPEFQDFRASVGRKLQDHESRIEELEKDADIPHPHKH